MSLLSTQKKHNMEQGYKYAQSQPKETWKCNWKEMPNVLGNLKEALTLRLYRLTFLTLNQEIDWILMNNLIETFPENNLNSFCIKPKKGEKVDITGENLKESISFWVGH